MTESTADSSPALNLTLEDPKLEAALAAAAKGEESLPIEPRGKASVSAAARRP